MRRRGTNEQAPRPRRVPASVATIPKPVAVSGQVLPRPRQPRRWLWAYEQLRAAGRRVARLRPNPHRYSPAHEPYEVKVAHNGRRAAGRTRPYFGGALRLPHPIAAVSAFLIGVTGLVLLLDALIRGHRFSIVRAQR